MSEWLKIVKKHAKLNPGKSLKEYLPAAKEEYQKLKASGKVVLKSVVDTGKKMISKKKGKKQRGGGDSSDRKANGGDIARGAVDELEGEDEETSLVHEHEPCLDDDGEVILDNNGEPVRAPCEPEEEPEGDEADQNGGGYKAVVSLQGRTRAGGKRGVSKRKRKSSRNVDVAVAQSLAAAAPMISPRMVAIARARTRTRIGGKKSKKVRKSRKSRKSLKLKKSRKYGKSKKSRKSRKMKKSRNNHKPKSDITSTNLA